MWDRLTITASVSFFCYSINEMSTGPARLYVRLLNGIKFCFHFNFPFPLSRIRWKLLRFSLVLARVLLAATETILNTSEISWYCSQLFYRKVEQNIIHFVGTSIVSFRRGNCSCKTIAIDEKTFAYNAHIRMWDGTTKQREALLLLRSRTLARWRRRELGNVWKTYSKRE